MSNNGAAGVDEMPESELENYLREHWVRLKADLLEDRYLPQNGAESRNTETERRRMRQLGIFTVMDRFIQQALHQVLVPC